MQSLGERLIELSDEQIATLDLDDPLREAIVEARNIGARGALRRQKQLIGKLMRLADPGPIRASLERLERHERLAKAEFRRTEAWRDRLVSEGRPALSELRRETGRYFDSLGKLVDELGAVQHDAARRRISRQIFRELHKGLTVQKRPG